MVVGQPLNLLALSEGDFFFGKLCLQLLNPVLGLVKLLSHLP